ncbi:hypothetical protein LTR08_002887 [Meristemomyces frigidus]|nr:hypothetical protein LTR08_002887 [Meristemomyces frigidus]
MPTLSTYAFAAASFLAAASVASPTPAKDPSIITKVAVRTAASTTAISKSNQLAAALSSFSAGLNSISAAVTVGQAILTQIVPAPGPTAIPQLQAELQNITTANDGDIFRSGAEIVLNGLAGGNYAQIANAYLIDSTTVNINLVQPTTSVYPNASSQDAPYSLSEAALRQAIYIPPGFTYGRIPPVIFLEGTAAFAGQNFGPNYGKLLTGSTFADPVYLNVPMRNLLDKQLAAEYTAYAVNYISGISGGNNVSTISWSAGSLDGQWALKYWPSTRAKMSNKICISPDYHGTIEAQSACPGVTTPECTPAIAQQNYNSSFIQTLRNNGGDSAYVPTTNVYSIFDQIVEPQEDPNASGFLNDARMVGVTNVELQSVCTAVLPGGEIYNTHEGVLYNALGYALAVDALTNGGPGQLSRVDVKGLCAQVATAGLSLTDIEATEALIPIAALAILAYEPKVAVEPPIMAYAQDVPAS